MDRIIIEGRNKLSGSVRISGSKNAALPIIASTILTAKACVLTNVPMLNDVLVMNKLLKTVGGEAEFSGSSLFIHNKSISNFKAPYDLVKTMRASVYVMGALLGRYREAEVALPGGCVIGERPINLHLQGFEKLGAKINIEDGYIRAKAK